MSRFLILSTLALGGMFAMPAQAIVLDGVLDSPNMLTLRATQNSPTSFGNAVGDMMGTGTQESAGGSELNQLFANIENGILTITLTGNLEGNFNKAWIFLDVVAGGENVLANDNVDGGFNEINALAGLTFANGATMDHGLRMEVGGGFYGIREFDLIANTGGDIVTGGGVAALPILNLGSNGVMVGWNNANVMGVTGAGDSAQALIDAPSATMGWEFEIDLIDAYGGSQGDIQIAALITSDNGTFISNQVLPGIGAADSMTNVGAPATATIGTITIPGPILGAIPGDVDGDGDVDFIETDMDMLSDFDIIRNNFLNLTSLRSEGNLVDFGASAGIVDIADFRQWKDNFQGPPAQLAAALESLFGGSQVPEPGSVALTIVACAGLGLAVRRRR